MVWCHIVKITDLFRVVQAKQTSISDVNFWYTDHKIIK